MELARARLDNAQLTSAVALARIYDPEGAAAVGYLDDAVDEEAFSTQLDALLGAFASLDMKAHRETKARIREPLLERLDEAMSKDFAVFA